MPALIDMGARVMTSMVPGFQIPYDPCSFGNGSAVAPLTTAGFARISEIELSMDLHLGPASAEATWALGMMPYLGTIAKLVELQPQGWHFARARGAWELESAQHVEPSSGDVVIRGLKYRLITASS